MMLFRPPTIQRIRKSDVVLDGGRTRLRVVVSGWGRLTLSLASPDGTVERRRLRFLGGVREFHIDVLPPGAVTVDARNPFGGVATTLEVRADLPGVVELALPTIRPVAAVAPPAGPVLSPVPMPVVRLPELRHVGAPRLRLEEIAVRTNDGSRSMEAGQ